MKRFLEIHLRLHGDTSAPPG